MSWLVSEIAQAQSCQPWMSTSPESNDMCVVKAIMYEEKL